MSEIIVLTQLARKLHLTFRLLVPPSISVLVISITILFLIPTLTIIFSFQAVGFLLGSTIARKAHSPIG